MRGQNIEKIENFVREKLEKDSSGHDWWHILRVKNLATHIANEEMADSEYCEILALLHETADHKLVTNEKESLEELKIYLSEAGIDPLTINRLIQEIPLISYKGAGVADAESSKECEIVRDADRLDAIGAIGIARTFAYGGKHNRLLYHPEIEPENHNSFEAYKSNNNPTINHFYEKLLLLKDRMHTNTAKAIATERHKRMEEFIDNFMQEWWLKDLKQD